MQVRYALTSAAKNRHIEHAEKWIANINYSQQTAQNNLNSRLKPVNNPPHKKSIGKATTATNPKPVSSEYHYG
jgi:hypothetical protein